MNREENAHMNRISSSNRLRQVERLTFYDLLTELPNRLMLENHLFQKISASKLDQTAFALLLIDLTKLRLSRIC